MFPADADGPGVSPIDNMLSSTLTISMVSVLSTTSIKIRFNVLVNHAFIITPLLVYCSIGQDQRVEPKFI